MKVLAFNSSPNMENGNTALILNPFLKGMREAGADVELFYTKNLKINPCQSDFNCWFKTLGQCFQKDDMQMLSPKLDADIIVFATPLYVDGMNGSMKNLMDRMLPLLQPYFQLRDGHCRHPLRVNIEGRQVVLISTCGLWEMDNFDSLVFHMKAICRNMNREFAGALLRPHGSVLKGMLSMGAPVKDIIEAAEEAGRQLVKDRKMSANTLAVISPRPLIPLEVYIQNLNQTFNQLLSAAGKN